MPSSRGAVVTGATGALGSVVVKAFLDQGARVVSTYRSEEKQNKLVSFLGGTSDALISIKTDVTNEANVQALFQKVVEKHGRADVLLNIVGAYKGGTEIANTKETDWDSMMNINLKSAFLCSKAALPHMMRQNYGRIVNVASRTALEKRLPQ